MQVPISAPDELPSDPAIEEAITLIRQVREEHGPRQAMIIVHCTNGLNRTGYFMAHVCRTCVAVSHA